MALIKADRVRESSTTTGTGAFTLSGAEATFRAFSAVCTTGDTFYYTIAHRTANEWETGLGTYSSANTLTRTTVHASSNSGSAVNFSAGTKEVFLTLTARHLDRINDNGQSTAIGSKTSVVAVNDSATLPDLDLQFSELKTLTAKYGPTPSYSRASTGRYTNASGVLTSAAVNEPRFDHVLENGVWVSKGLLIEEQRTNLTAYSEQFDNAYWSKTRMTVSANSVAGPDNQTAAELVYPDTTGIYSYVNRPIGTISNLASYTISCFFKYAGKRWVYFYGPNGSYLTWFDIQNGVLGTVAAQATSASIRNVGNGWYRCVAVYNTVNTAGYFTFGASDSNESQTVTASGTDGFYAWGSQFELGSFPTSYIPTVASSVVRSADVCQITGSAFTNLWNATEGTISLEQDLLSYSDPAADQRYFTIAGGSNNPGLTLHYDGGSSFYWERYFSGLDYLVLPDVNSAFKTAIAFKTNDYATVLNGGTPVTSSTKTLPTTFVKIDIGYQVGATARSSWVSRLRYFRSRLDNTQLVNLSGGINTLAFKPVTGSGSVTVANEYSGINISVPNPLPITNGGTGAQTQLAAVTNLISNPPNDGGQYTLASKKTSGSPSFYWVDSTGYAPTLDLLFAADKSLTAYTGPTPSFSRASTGTFFNSSGTLTTAAVNGPRFNHVYNGSIWVSKGLLVEEQRTNSLRQSNTFNTTWVALDGAVVANSGTSPDGTNNAWKLNELATTTTAHGIYQTLTIPGGACTWSIFAKAGERSWLQFLAYNSTTNFPTWFNLSNGTIGTNAAGNTATITPVGNGWYRCSLTRSAGADYAQIYTANGDNNASYLGQVGNGVYIYGAQVETGSFPTSYIPTTTAAVTRSADVCQITGTDFSSFWNSSEGSFAVEFDRLGAVDSNFSSGYPRIVAAVKTADTSRAITLFASQSPSGEAFYVQDGTLQAWFAAGALTAANQQAKLASAYKVNDFSASLNGAAVATDLSGTVPSAIDRMDIGNEYGVTRYHNGHIARLRYYPTRLPNATLQVLST